MENSFLAIELAIRDWFHERTLSLCAVLALASMLAPLLILQGVRTGVVTSMREKLMQDPSVLVITPLSGALEGGYTREAIQRLSRLDGCRFAIGRVREIASDITLKTRDGKIASIHMEPCAPGEPVLEHNNIVIPKDGTIPELVLSESACKKLGCSIGDTLNANLGRKNHLGRFESVNLQMKLVGILPNHVANRLMGFMPNTLLEDIEDFRDDLAVERRKWEGREKKNERPYASFRLYAKDLDAVPQLTEALSRLGLEVRTSAREINQIHALESALNRIILLISSAVGAGFVAFMLSSTLGSIRRKMRMLGMLRLLGFSRFSLIVYPLVQSFVTAFFGSLVGLLAYFIVGVAIDTAFSEENAALCVLSERDFFLTFFCVLLLSSLASLKGALKASRVDPSQAIREV